MRLSVSRLVSAIAGTAVFVVFLVLTTLLPAATATARTIAVPDDYPTIGEALASARAGDFLLIGCGVYRERNLTLPAGVTLWSATLQADCVVIDAQGRGRVFFCQDADSTTSVVGLTLRGGYTVNDGGLVFADDAAVKFSRCRFEGGAATRGGAIAAVGSRGPTLEDCVLVGNVASRAGGAVYWRAGGRGRLERCELARNMALDGGAIAAAGPADVTIMQCRILANEAGGTGGAVWLDGGNLRLERSVIARNVGGLGGSALASLGGRPQLINCTVVENEADIDGTAILARSGMVRGEWSLLAYNQPGSIGSQPGGYVDLVGCNIYGHPQGDWVGPVATLREDPSNFSADPQFCGIASMSYGLRRGSPCLPGGRDGRTAQLVGAIGQGCD